MASKETATAKRTLVFVYGTLKTGLYNYTTYLLPAIELGKASLVGAGRTTNEEFHMVLDDQAFYPCLYRAPTEGYRVDGEVYSVDDDTLAALDVLEEVDDDLYARDEIDVDLLEGERKGETLPCQVYLMPIFDDDLPKLERITNYTAAMNVKYDELMGDPQLEILECIYGKEVTHAVEAKVKGGMDFADAWKIVVKA